jgi:hypothetical protein
MIHHRTAARLRRLNDRVNHYLDYALGGFTVLAAHEAGALSGYWSDIGVRLAVARRARGTGELLRDQIDLLPELRNRVLRDQRVRRELWRGLVKDLAMQEHKAA